MGHCPRGFAYPAFVRASAIAAFAVLIVVPGIGAQDADTLRMTLPEITVDAVRETETAARAPYALSVDVRGPEEIAFEPALSLDAVLRSMPGVWINDRGHFALGERISVRGMGARAAFGVRGVQVLLDGIPLTMPDGQAVLDVVEPAVLRRTELLRSPASLFWGNGSGGVLFLSSGDRGAAPSLRGRALAGAYGQRHLLIDGGTSFGDHSVHAWASNHEQNGFRDYSEGFRTRGGAIGRFRLAERTLLRAVAAAAYQETDHPGSLTRAEVESNPRLARPGYPDVRAGKTSLQVQGGATIDHESGLGLVTATLYGISRSLDNPLPFAYIDLERAAGGFRAAFKRTSGRFQWGLGTDAAIQHDIRKNFNNDAGEPGNSLDLDQIEDVTAGGAFAFAHVELTPLLHATGGVRYSRVHFEMEDRLLANGDESGSRRFSAWSPSVGISYRLHGALLFANYGTAFETPTTTELVNRPDMTGGFNPELDAQISKGVEVGVRGALGATLAFDAAVFLMWVDGRLISFENALGREFFRDAGENTHRGVELGLAWIPAPAVELEVSYTGSRYEFTDADLDGNLIPGVPEHRLFTGLEVSRAGVFGRLEAEAVSEYYVDDANTEENDAYVVFDLSAGHRGIGLSSARLQPFLTVRNLFDTRYSGSVVVNAFGGRYYEPSPGRAVLAGIVISF